MQTTCIGAFPKPPYITTGNWRETENQVGGSARTFIYTNDQASTAPVEMLDKATTEAVNDQVECGIDIPTDGEQRRENLYSLSLSASYWH